ncbi:MAG: DUF2784 family protein [Candidatus Auribacterota bacterium]|jgi:hypothetical protein|nr:DUF2784 family protein [Candidatus Auribacterota bacterium]
MAYKVISDMILVIHLCWIIFMLWGFILTVRSIVQFISGNRNMAATFLDRWVFRSVHTAGIIFVAVLAVLRKYCPLTVIENFFRYRHEPSSTYPGSFIVYFIEKIVYPDVNPLMIIIPTVVVAVISLLAYMILPPDRTVLFLRKIINPNHNMLM